MNSLIAVCKRRWCARSKNAVRLLGGIFAVLLLCLPAFSRRQLRPNSRNSHRPVLRRHSRRHGNGRRYGREVWLEPSPRMTRRSNARSLLPGME